MGIFIQSCADSLGLDPNVKVTSVADVDTTTPPDTSGGGTTTPKPYKISKYELLIFETFRTQNNKFYDEWINPKKECEITIDTAINKIKLSIDLKLENPKKDLPLLPRRDRIINSDLEFSSFIADDVEFNLNGIGNQNIMKIDLEYRDQNQQKYIRYFNGKDHYSKLKIDRINLIDKIIDVKVLFEPDSKFETETYTIVMRLFY
jgi:hypothetical protein